MTSDHLFAALTAYITARHKTFAAWTAGITDDPGRRKQEHGRPAAWFCLPASSEGDARSVERQLLSLGLKGGIGGPSNGHYVYVF